MGDSRLTQATVEAFGSLGSDSRVTQSAVEVFGPRANPSRFTQAAVEVFSLRKACVTVPCPYHVTETTAHATHRYATLWDIERPDGATYYFTDHCGALVFDAQVYTPVGGPSSSAKEHPSSASEHTVELSAAMVVGGVELSDLEAGKWSGSRLTERVVDWRYPWNGCIRKHRWYMREVRHDGERWTAQLGGIASAHHKKKGEAYSRACTRDLGDAFGTSERGCKFDLPGAQESGAVSALFDVTRSFRATGLAAAHGDDYFPDGRLVWLTGANAGQESDIKVSTEQTGAYDFEVMLGLPEPIAIGDTFTLGPGCAKDLIDCTFFAQIENRQAFDFMPGEDGKSVNPLQV